MRHTLRLAAAIVGAAAMSVAAIAVAQPPHGAATAQIAPPAKDDPHVAKLYEIVKAAHAPGAHVDHQKMAADIKALAREHAVEVGQDPAAMEAHVMQVVHNAVMAVQAHPEKLATLDGFWEALHASGGSAGHH